MHIKKVTLHRFKQFRDAEIGLENGLSLIVGGNNSGKSSILQALATWQFCKTMLEIEKGRSSWLQTKAKTGLGMGIADFTPMQIPSLTHLWTNLKANKEKEPDGYTLKIGVYWPESVTPEPATAWLAPMASKIAVHRPFGAAALLPWCVGRLS